jgi:hypothetical protein
MLIPILFVKFVLIASFHHYACVILLYLLKCNFILFFIIQFKLLRMPSFSS